MTPELLAKYDARVPRYTSYPTAPHFGPEVGAQSYREWLGALDPCEPLSLYLHVPFCAKLCWYCGCHTTVTGTYAPIANYRELLIREIELVAAAIPFRAGVTQIHWGGGTPTILTPDDFAEVCENLRRRFEVSPELQMSVEIDPRQFTRDMAEALARNGTTRASLGVQDFDPRVQQAVNRIQPYEVTARAVDWLRAEMIDDINVDLIYGLPHQSVESIVATVDRVMLLAPEQVALFGYAHVPWMKRHQRLIDESQLPGPRERWALYWAASARLKEHRLVPIGLDHFAAAGSVLAAASAAHRLHRNFQGYTADDANTLLGFGASAIGTLPQGYVQNAPKIAEYRERISAGELATTRGRAVSRADLLRREVISRLMCDLRVDVATLCRVHGFAAGFLDRDIAALTSLASDGIVGIEDRTVTVDESARPLVRTVCAAFDAYLKTSSNPSAGSNAQAEPRHAAAV